MTCFIISGQFAEIKHSSIERDKFDVFSKSYLNRLVGYYANYFKDIALILPERYESLNERITEDYPNVNINAIDFTKMAKDEHCLFINSKYVYTNAEYIDKIEQVIHQAADEVRVYKRKEKVVGVSAPKEKVQSLLLSEDELFSKNDVLSTMAAYFLNSDETAAEVHVKKKNILTVKSLSDVQAFIKLINQMKLHSLLSEGVLVWDLESTFISPEVKIGENTLIQPNTIILGDTIIGSNCAIGPSARIENSKLGNEISVKDSTVLSSCIDDYTNVGPYAYLRPNSDIGKNVKVGDFVEVKNSRIDDGSKVSHLSYIGDGHIGKHVNVGCGTIFVNYDGTHKHKTVVGDGVFIGCNANLVAPVTIEDGAVIAAGSTITDDVEAHSLAIARTRQIVKPGWHKK